MISVIVAAHDEAAVIGRCLDAIAGQGVPGDLDVTVVANGCTDDTALRVQKYPWVRLLDLPESGKALALNAGDAVAVGFPRVYLDADMVLTAAELRRLVQPLIDGSTGFQVAVPDRRMDVAGRPLLVRAYYAVQTRLPAFEDGLFGRGVIAVSQAGRSRFAQFPAVVADDLFLDSIFTAAERIRVDEVVSVVATPRRLRDLLNRLTRVRRGNAELRAAATEPGSPGAGFTGLGSVGTGSAVRVRQADRFAWLREVVWRRPWLAPAAGCYVGITVYAALAARRSAGRPVAWLRDESSRSENRSEAVDE